MALLHLLTDDELVRHCDSADHPLVTTDLERELLRRLVDTAKFSDFAPVLEEYSIDTPEALRKNLEETDDARQKLEDDLVELQTVMHEFDIFDAKDLRKALESLPA